MKTYILDFDGTIANTLPHIIECTKKIIAKFNLLELKSENISKFNGATLENVLMYLGARKEDLSCMKLYYNEIFLTDISDIKLYSNVLNTIKILKSQENIIVVASNRGKQSLNILLNNLQLTPYLDLVIAKEDVKNQKPAVDIVDYVKKEFNVSNDDIIIVGDSKFDIQMGINAQCKTVGVDYNKELRQTLGDLKPDCIIEDFKSLLDIK